MTRDNPHPKSDSVILQEGPEEEVLTLLERMGEGLTEEQAFYLLDNPNLTWTSLRVIAEDAGLRANHKIQFALVKNPATPHAAASRLIPQLYWKELLEVTVNLRVPPLTRRNAEKYLKDRLEGMGLGEKISLARRAPPSVISSLRREKNVKVIAALMDNPRMTTTHVLVIANNPTTPSDVLAHLAQTTRWVNQYQVKMALIKNPQTPLGTAMGFLSSLKRVDLRGLSKNPSLNPALKVAAARILEKR